MINFTTYDQDLLGDLGAILSRVEHGLEPLHISEDLMLFLYEQYLLDSMTQLTHFGTKGSWQCFYYGHPLLKPDGDPWMSAEVRALYAERNPPPFQLTEPDFEVSSDALDQILNSQEN